MGEECAAQLSAMKSLGAKGAAPMGRREYIQSRIDQKNPNVRQVLRCGIRRETCQPPPLVTYLYRAKQKERINAAGPNLANSTLFWTASDMVGRTLPISARPSIPGDKPRGVLAVDRKFEPVVSRRDSENLHRSRREHPLFERRLSIPKLRGSPISGFTRMGR